MADEACGLLIKQIHSLMSKRANKSLKDCGVTLSQVAALRVIVEQPGHAAAFKLIERSLKVSQPTTVGLIARLREKGLIETYDDPDSPNAKIARLTPAGEAVCDRSLADMQAEDERMFAGFTPEERAQFMAMLARIAANVGG